MTGRRPDWCTVLCASLPAVVGQRVLVVTEEADPWWKALYARSVAEIVVAVGTLAPRGENPWPDHRVRYLQLGREWPTLGEFDVVCVVGLYASWYGQCGDHERIWRWLARHVRPVSGRLYWIGATDTRDVAAALATLRVRGYKAKYIAAAAARVFHTVTPLGAGPVPFSEVWLAAGRDDDKGNQQNECDRAGVRRGGTQPARVDRGRVAGGSERGGVVAVCGDAQPHAATTGEAGTVGRTGPYDLERHMVVGLGTMCAGGVEPRSDPPPAAGCCDGGDRGPAQPTPQLGSAGRGCSALPPAHPEWALILGGAAAVWDEVLAWEALYGRQWDGLVVAANDVGSHWPRDLHHWVSLHPDRLAGWQALRTSYGHSDGYLTWGRVGRPVARNLRPWAGGSSGMFAIQVAQHVGAVRAVLCGIPMTPTQHFAESTVHDGRPWTAVAGHWRAWERHADKIQGWVKSMSGRSQELLGAPTLEWLYGTAPTS